VGQAIQTTASTSAATTTIAVIFCSLVRNIRRRRAFTGGHTGARDRERPDRSSHQGARAAGRGVSGRTLTSTPERLVGCTALVAHRASTVAGADPD
jgi:hypothetical protein